MIESILILSVVVLIGFMAWDYHQRGKIEQKNKEDFLKLQDIISQERNQLSKLIEKINLSNEKNFSNYLRHIQGLEKSFLPTQNSYKNPRPIENDIEKKEAEEDKPQEIDAETLSRIVALGSNVKIIRDDVESELPTQIL